MTAGKQDPLRCEHDRTRATCEACAHAAALTDATGRAAATRDELYPFADGGAITTGFLPDEPSVDEDNGPPTTKKGRRAAT